MLVLLPWSWNVAVGALFTALKREKLRLSEDPDVTHVWLDNKGTFYSAAQGTGPFFRFSGRGSAGSLFPSLPAGLSHVLCAQGCVVSLVPDGRGADVRRGPCGVGGCPAVPADDRQLAAVQPPQAVALWDPLHEPHQGGKPLRNGPAPLISFLPTPIFFWFNSIWFLPFLVVFFSSRQSSLILLCIRSLKGKTAFLFESRFPWFIIWNKNIWKGEITTF